MDNLDPSIPLRMSVLVAEKDDAVLMVHNAWRREWELPGGVIEDHESARETAVREFLDETGVPAGDDVDFVGVATVQLGHERRIEFAAVYQTSLTGPVALEPNDEIDDIHWWDLTSELPGLSGIDAHLAQLAVEAPAAD